MVYKSKQRALTVIKGVFKLIDLESGKITDLETSKSVKIDALRMYDVVTREVGFTLFMLCEERGVKFV